MINIKDKKYIYYNCIKDKASFQGTLKDGTPRSEHAERRLEESAKARELPAASLDNSGQEMPCNYFF